MQNEQEIIRKCLDGHRASQKAIYEYFASKMLGVCYRYAGSMHDAEDIMQEGFIKAFSFIHQYKFEGAFEAWLRKIMVNTALNFLTRNRRFKETIELTEADNSVYEPVDAEARLNSLDIINTIKALPEGYRTVINLYSIEGYAHKEIAEMMGISESTSRSQYARGRVLLARILSAKGRIASASTEPVMINN